MAMCIGAPIRAAGNRRPKRVGRVTGSDLRLRERNRVRTVSRRSARKVSLHQSKVPVTAANPGTSNWTAATKTDNAAASGQTVTIDRAVEGVDVGGAVAGVRDSEYLLQSMR